MAGWFWWILKRRSYLRPIIIISILLVVSRLIPRIIFLLPVMSRAMLSFGGLLPRIILINSHYISHSMIRRVK